MADVGATFRMILKDRLAPHPHPGGGERGRLNTRDAFPVEELEELAASYAENGVQQTLLVRPVPEDLRKENGPTHWIVNGERRWRAALLTDEIISLPCKVQDMDELQAIRAMGVENIHRSDMAPVEEARWLELYMDRSGLTQTAVAEEIGKSQPWVANRLRLLELHPDVQGLVDTGTLAQAHARDIVLPFKSIPPAKWKELQETVASDLAKQAKSEERFPLAESDVRAAVRRAGVRLSRPLVPWSGQTWDYEKGYDVPAGGDLQRLHEEECDCGSPLFQWARSSRADRSRRCFDVDTWNGLNARAHELHEERQATAEEAEGQEVDPLEWDDPSEMVPSHVWEEYGGPRRRLSPGDELVDYRLLSPDRIFLVEGNEWAPHGRIFTTDLEGYREAREHGKARIEREYEEAWEARRAADRQEALNREVDLEILLELVAGLPGVSGWSWARYLPSLVDEYNLGELEVADAPAAGLLAHRLLRSDVREFLLGLRPDKFELLVKVLAIRLRDGQVALRGTHDPLEAQLRDEHHEELLDVFAERVAFDASWLVEGQKEE